MRNGRGEALQRLHSVSFIKNLRLEKEFLNVLCHVLEVDCNSGFLQVLNSLGTNKSKLTFISTFNSMLQVLIVG